MLTEESASPAVDLAHQLDFGPWTLQQKVIVFLAALIVIFDGFDIQVMGFAIPAIAKDWHVARSAFSSILGLGLFGLTIGTACGGYLGDRFGRRIALLINILIFAAATLGMAAANTLTALLVLRFIAGLGIGGALPNTATLTAEFTPLNRRALAVTMTIVCVPLGGLIAGLVSAQTLMTHSWRLLFVVGGFAPLVLLLILLVYLPESPRFLARDATRFEELRKVLQRIGRPIPSDASINYAPAGSHKIPLREIFAGGLATDTFALWIAFFCCLTTVYLAFNWLPSVLVGSAFSLKEASQGLSYYNLGGIAGALGFGFWINKRGSRLPMLVGSVCAIIAALIAAALLHEHLGPSTALFAAIAANGLFVNAVQTTMYALATHVYATRIRATGVASAMAIGRTGAILSAFAGGLTLKLQPSIYFAILAVGMAGAFAALFFMKRHIGSPAAS